MSQTIGEKIQSPAAVAAKDIGPLDRWLRSLAARTSRSGALFKGLIGVQLAAIVALGLLTVFSFQIWALIDEDSHFDYVATVADKHRLPTLVVGGKLEDAVGIHTSEAFQPPVYYIAAAPLLKLSNSQHTRVLLVRSFDFALLMLSVYALWRLVRVALESARLQAFSFGLLFFLLPAVVVRSITVSYLPLALLETIVFITLLIKAHRTPGAAGFRSLLAAGVVLGLAVLTSLLLAYLAVLYAAVLLQRVRLERGGRMILRALAAAALPLLLVSPWLVFNEAEYGSLTANGVARQMQEPTINPQNHRYTVGELPHITSEFRVSGVMAEEWGHYNAEIWSLTELRDFLVATFFILPILILLASWRSFRGDHVGLLGAPLLVAIVFLDGATWAANWPVTAGRYLHSAGPAWMLFAFVAFQQAMSRKAVVNALLMFGTLGALWFWIQIGPRYF